MRRFNYFTFSIIAICFLSSCSSLGVKTVSQISRPDPVQCQKAINELSQTIKLNPNDKTAYARRAYYCSSLGKYQAAIKDCDESIRLGTDDSDIYDNRGYSHTSVCS